MFKIYKFYLNLEQDPEVRRFYRYMPMQSIKGKVFNFIKLIYYLTLSQLLPFRRTKFYIVLDNKDNVVGICHITAYPSLRYGIYGIALSRDVRGKGVAKILSLYAIIDTLQTSIRNIYLYVDTDNTRAINLYKKLGFKISSIINKYDYRYLEDRYIDAFLMKLNAYEFVKHAKKLCRKVKCEMKRSKLTC